MSKSLTKRFVSVILVSVFFTIVFTLWTIVSSPLICNRRKPQKVYKFIIEQQQHGKEKLSGENGNIKNHFPTSTTLPSEPNFILEDENWFPAGVYGDNYTGYPFMIVPNIVHYVLFSRREITFSHMISILSVLIHQKPDWIMIHCDCNKIHGMYWERVMWEVNKMNKTKITIRKVKKPKIIFDKKIAEDVSDWHGSDIMRIMVLLQFGGIYLDTDVYVVRSLDVFRKFEMTLNWDEDQFLGSQVLIGNKNARFLKFYLESYRWYDGSQWYFNGGELPTTSILYKYPQLVHRVKYQFGVDAPKVCPRIFREYIPDWQREFFTVHLTLRGHEFAWPEWCFGKNYPPVMRFDQESVKTLNVTFGEMARLVLYGQKEIIN